LRIKELSLEQYCEERRKAKNNIVKKAGKLRIIL
jgi:hypothetical protein